MKCPCGEGGEYGTKGKCEGKTLKYCIGDKLKTTDCSKNTSKPFCGYDAKAKYYNCIKKPIVVLKQNGAPCTAHGQCLSGSCVSGKCGQPQ